MPSASPITAHTAAPRRWLSIVGIGEDGVDGLSPVARRLVSDAELVLGGKRHLALADPLIKSQQISWPSPIGNVLPEIEKHRGRPVAVLGPISGRPRWMSNAEFVRRFAGRQADAALAGELRQLAPDYTDDLR